MVAPTYNAAKHHIGLKDKGGATNYGFMISPGYRREMQREAVGAPDFGGATDLIGQTPSLSRWTQDDFTGGLGQWQWGRDDAMFADCTGFMPDGQGRELVSCPPMFLKFAKDVDVETGYVSDDARRIFIVAGSIYTVFGHGILRVIIGTGVQSWIGRTTLLADATETIIDAIYDPGDQRIVVMVDDSSAATVIKFKYVNAGTMTMMTNSEDSGPAGAYRARGFALFGDDILAQIGNKVYLGDVKVDFDNAAAAGDTTWTTLGRLPGRWRDHVEFNGMIYILSNNLTGASTPTFVSHITAFDGDSLIPIATIPHSFMAKTIESYGGRVYIGGTGTDVNAGEHYAELYEMTGTSLRMVRTFSPETRRQLLSTGDWPQSIDDMTIHEGLLWFCQKGKRMMAYDQTSDAFYGASEILSNSDLNIQRLTSGVGRMWGWGIDDTDDTKHGIYRIAQPADISTGWNPTLVTSDFVYEPGLKKRWSEIKIMTRYGPVEFLEYSINSGSSWTSLSVTTDSTYAPIYYATATLVGIVPTEHIRFRIKLDCDTPNNAVTYHRELIAYTVQYAMLDNGKRAWSLTIINAEEVETEDALFDESIAQVQDVSAIQTLIEGYAFNKTPLTFTDIDQSTYDCSIIGYTLSMPQIGYDSTGTTRHESMLTLSLLEV